MMMSDADRVFRRSGGVDDEDGKNEQNPRELKTPLGIGRQCCSDAPEYGKFGSMILCPEVPSDFRTWP